MREYIKDIWCDYMDKKKNNELLFKSIGENMCENFYNGCENKEEYLKELSQSLHRYIKTGISNQQLDEFLYIQDELKRKKQECFNIENIIQMVIENTKKDLWNKYVDFSIDNKELQSEFLDNFCKNIEDCFISIIEDVIYLSHMNVLYELYEHYQQLYKNNE